MPDKVYVFNRRLVDDQRLYVKASSPKEAWAKARAEDVWDTSSPETVKVTLRRIPDEDQPA